MKWFKKLFQEKFGNPNNNQINNLNDNLNNNNNNNNSLIIIKSENKEICNKDIDEMKNSSLNHSSPGSSKDLCYPPSTSSSPSSSSDLKQYYNKNDINRSHDKNKNCVNEILNNELNKDLKRMRKNANSNGTNKFDNDLIEQANNLENIINDEEIIKNSDDSTDWEFINKEKLESEIKKSKRSTKSRKKSRNNHSNDDGSYNSYDNYYNSYDNISYGMYYSFPSQHYLPEMTYCDSMIKLQIQHKRSKISKQSILSIWLDDCKSKIDGEFIDEDLYHYKNDEKYKNRNRVGRTPKTNSECEAFENSLMGPLLDVRPSTSKGDYNDNKKIDTNPKVDNENDEDEDLKNRKLLNKEHETFSIKKFFGLNDDGDIILHIDHIIEYHGISFDDKFDENVIIGLEVSDKLFFENKFKTFFTNIFYNNNDNGHPRNKSQQPGGPGDSIGAYTLALAADHNSTFARNIENFIECTKESREVAPQIVMRNMRQFMSGMKNYLVKHGEGDFQLEVQRARSRLKSDEFLNLDTILESVMHRLVVLPLREHLYGLFVDYYKKTGDIQLLVDNINYACQRTATDFGIRPSVIPPSVPILQQISNILIKLQEAELPLEKLDFLLAAVSAIFESTGSSKGQHLGADDFLPLLVLIVAKTGFYSAEIEAEFMWNLVQPSLLSGEAGYYLTALCSAVHVLKSFMSSEVEGTGSLDWRSSSLPASSSVLRVIIPDEYNGSLQTRTLPVRPHTTTKDVCRTIAHKARITNPQDYGLFKLVDGEETLLMENECPQDIRIAARGKHCILAYKRIDAKIAWPTLPASSF